MNNLIRLQSFSSVTVCRSERRETGNKRSEREGRRQEDVKDKRTGAAELTCTNKSNRTSVLIRTFEKWFPDKFE